jgi:hypothetical protein
MLVHGRQRLYGHVAKILILSCSSAQLGHIIYTTGFSFSLRLSDAYTIELLRLAYRLRGIL